MRTRIAAAALCLLVSTAASGQEDLSFAAISSRHPVVRMTDAELVIAQGVENSARQGECLAGIKTLNALPMDEFQPNIEWLNTAPRRCLRSRARATCLRCSRPRTTRSRLPTRLSSGSDADRRCCTGAVMSDPTAA